MDPRRITGGRRIDRFLREIRLAWPALRLAGVDLSSAYLAETKRHMGSLRPAALIEANAESIPLQRAQACSPQLGPVASKEAQPNFSAIGVSRQQNV